MRIDAGRSLCLALAVVLAVALAQLSAASAEPRIVWHVENPFRFFLDAADTQVHRATWASLSEAERRRPVLGGRARAGRAPPRRLGATMFAKTCWDYAAQSLFLPRPPRLSQPQEPHHPGAHGGARRLADGRLHLAHLAARQGPARQGRHAALRHAGAARDPLSRRRLGQRRDRRPAGGGGGGARHRPVRRRHGRQLRLRRGQPGCARALLARPHDRLRRRLQRHGALRLSRPHRRLARHRRQQVHRGERPLAGPGLPSLALFAPAADRAAARRGGPAPRRDVRGRGLLGRRDHVRPVPRATRATSGCPTRRTCRRSRPWPRPSAAAAARATTTCPRPITSTTRSPSSRAASCSRSAIAEQGAQDRSAVPLARRQRHRLLRGWSPTRCWPTSRCCAGWAAGSATCTASPRPPTSSTPSTIA